jgi:hypothetical protein
VLWGKEAQRRLEGSSILLETPFPPETILEDEWALPVPNQEIEAAQIAKLKEEVTKRVRVHCIICNYNDYLLLPMHADPQSDADSKEHDKFTQFVQTNADKHPTSQDPRKISLIPKVEWDLVRLWTAVNVTSTATITCGNTIANKQETSYAFKSRHN